MGAEGSGGAGSYRDVTIRVGDRGTAQSMWPYSGMAPVYQPRSAPGTHGRQFLGSKRRSSRGSIEQAGCKDKEGALGELGLLWKCGAV